MSRPNRNVEIERKVAIILAMPEPPKKPTRKQMLANNAIYILNRFEDKINQAIYFNR